MSASSSEFQTAVSTPTAYLPSPLRRRHKRTQIRIAELERRLACEARKRKASNTPLRPASIRKRFIMLDRAPSVKKEPTPSIFRRMQGPPKLLTGSPSYHVVNTKNV